VLSAVRRSFLFVGSVVMAAVLGSAGVARGGSTGGAGTAGCGGTSCWGAVQVTLSGPGADGPPNTSFVSVNVPPPQCWYGTPPPALTAAQMYQFLLQYEKGSPGAPPILFTGWSATVQQIMAQHNGTMPSDGLWYELNVNTTGAAIPACASTWSSFQWVPTGNQINEPAVPPQDLVLYALSRIHLPRPTVRLNPKGKSEVNLATFVTVTPPAGAVGNGQLYITAAIPATKQVVTVALTPGSAVVSSGAGGTAYSDCGPAGSKLTATQMNAAGPGTPPDCGVLYQQPSTSGGITLTVNQNWTATAYEGVFVPGQTGDLLPAGDQDLQSPPNIQQVVVQEIQSVNGG